MALQYRYCVSRTEEITPHALLLPGARLNTIDDLEISDDQTPWSDSPCHGCGVCCRYFRISFYHGELDSQPGGYVPADLSVPLTPFRACMKGTEMGNGRCIAQAEDGSCTIYQNRPSVCREFPAFMEDGTLNPECIRLKRMFGLTAG